MKEKSTSPTTTLPKEPITRREVFKRVAAVGAVSLGAYTTAHAGPNAPAELTRLDEASPQALALGYKHEASEVDTAKFPQRDAASKICASCQLYQSGAGAQWAGCALFQGKVVSAKGWCTAWVKRVG